MKRTVGKLPEICLRAAGAFRFIVAAAPFPQPGRTMRLCRADAGTIAKKQYRHNKKQHQGCIKMEKLYIKHERKSV